MEFCNNVILTGDFNGNILKENNQYNDLVRALKSYNFYMVDFPTRITLKSESTS